MWLLKPSSTMLRISMLVVISLPSRHSSPNKEMEGTENIWEKEDGGFYYYIIESNTVPQLHGCVSHQRHDVNGTDGAVGGAAHAG